MTPKPTRVAVAACLAAPFVALLWLPWYARSGPGLTGVPFFYWYQLIWVPGSVLSTGVAYLLLRRAGRGGRSS